MAKLCFNSPLGKIALESEDDKIISIELGCEQPLIESDEACLLNAKSQLIEYFSRERKKLSFPIRITAVPFFSEIYKLMRKIPYGTTVAYQDLAIAAGKPQASRAVGMANHVNRLPLIVPCHRVIGKNNKLVGFSAGIWRKEALLALERGEEYHQPLGKDQERIYSFGLCTPPGEFYDQNRAELVKLESGYAVMEVEGEGITLVKNAEYLIEAHKKHRVTSTSWDCVWLCKHL